MSISDTFYSFVTKLMRGPPQTVFVVGGTVRSQAVGEVGGADPTPLLIDDITGAQVSIAEVHHEVHEGETFRAWFITPHASLIANDAFVDLIFATGAKYCHISFKVGFGGDCEFNIYRAPAYDLDGTVQVPHNLKDYSVKVATATVRWQPNVTDVGTEIDGEFLPGGSGGNSQGGSIKGDSEDIFAPNTAYLIRVTNRAGSSKQFSIESQWYEETTP